MLLMLFQIQMRLYPDFLLYVMLPIFLISEIAALKIALKVTNADTRTGLKWVLASFGAQIGIIAFVAFPLIIMAVSGANIDFGFILPIIILAIFLWMNILNIIHKLGVKRTIAVFILQLIPIFIIGGIIAGLISAAMSQLYSSQPTGGGEEYTENSLMFMIFAMMTVQYLSKQSLDYYKYWMAGTGPITIQFPY